MHRYIAPILSLPRTRPLHRVLHIPPDRAIACGQQMRRRSRRVASGKSRHAVRDAAIFCCCCRVENNASPVPGVQRPAAYSGGEPESRGTAGAHEPIVPSSGSELGARDNGPTTMAWLFLRHLFWQERGREAQAGRADRGTPARAPVRRELCWRRLSTPQCRAAWRLPAALEARGCSDRPAAWQRLARNAASVLYLRRLPTGDPTTPHLAAPATRPARRPTRASRSGSGGSSPFPRSTGP